MLYQKLAIATGAFALVSMVFVARDWKEEARETVQHVFSGDRSCDVDNINGFIRVIGDGGSTIRLEGEKILRAINKEAMERAKKEVTLDMNEKNGVAQVYVNGPFRGHGRRGDDSHGFHEHDDYRNYAVTYNLTAHVPRDMVPRLRTVNGSAAAEMRFKTLNGATYSDFDVTPMAGPAGQVERHDGRFIYRGNRMSAVKAGSGGPALSFETVNGSITINKGTN